MTKKIVLTTRSQFTRGEQILRLAISGKLWTFMDEEHHKHVRENLVVNDGFWIDYVDENDPDRTMGMIIERAEQLNIPYCVSDDLTCFGMVDVDKDKSPIYTMLIEIPDDEEDDEDLEDAA